MEFLWSVFYRIQTEYRDLQSKSLYSVQMLENTDQKISKFQHFSRNAGICLHNSSPFVPDSHERFGSCRLEIFCKRGELINFTRKNLFRNLYFDKVAGWRPATFKEKTSPQNFLVNFTKFIRTPFLENTSRR